MALGLQNSPALRGHAPVRDRVRARFTNDELANRHETPRVAHHEYRHLYAPTRERQRADPRQRPLKAKHQTPDSHARLWEQARRAHDVGAVHVHLRPSAGGAMAQDGAREAHRQERHTDLGAYHEGHGADRPWTYQDQERQQPHVGRRQ